MNLLDLQISIGDHVMLSTEAGQYGLGSGVVKDLQPTSVEIEMRDPLQVQKKKNFFFLKTDSKFCFFFWLWFKKQVSILSDIESFSSK